MLQAPNREADSKQTGSTQLISAMGFISILIIFSTVLSETSSEGNVGDWFSAQKTCRNLGKRLTANSSATMDYWTGKHKRYSQWINILGCYGDKDVKDKAVQTFNMEKDASIGLCQEYCLNRKSIIYAMKKSECRCLQTHLTTSSQSPSRCNYHCTNAEDASLSTECGGNGTYNVFSTAEDFGYSNGEQCVALACRNGDIAFDKRDCSDSLIMLCNSTDITPLKKKWRESLEECKSSHGLYAKGNIDLYNTSLTCLTIKQAWIGVFRERYISQDLGHTILDRKLYLKCQRCIEEDCAYEPCSTKIKNHVICSLLITSEQDTTTVHSFDDDSAKETAGGFFTIMFVIVSIVMGISGIIFFLYRRGTIKCTNCANFDKDKTESKMKNFTSCKSNTRSSITNQYRYPGKHSSSHVLENDDNDSEISDMHYDTSNWKNSRKQKTDNIYDHACSNNKSDYSSYDFTTTTINQNTLVENAYDVV